jgi:amino acid adenylation domain-containing protein
MPSLSPLCLPLLFDVQCEAGGERLAYAFVRDDLSVADQLSYRDLGRECHALAARIATLARPGDRILLAFPPGLDFVRAFWASMLAGCVAVPVPAPDPVRLLHGVPRLRGILDDARPALLLTAAPLLEAALRLFEPTALAATRWLALADLMAMAPVAQPDARALPDASALAFLQYTSGSTLAPRGVRLSHANVLANLRALAAAGRIGPESRILMWLPHFHDYGLICGVLCPLFAGATGWLMSPLSFLRRPTRWLDALASFGITHSGAPESAFVACLRALAGRPVAGDLSALVALSCGAEPIRADTVDRVVAEFGAAGMRPEAFMPGYGLAETVLGVSSSPIDQPPRCIVVDAVALQAHRVRPQPADAPRARRLVSCGRPLAETEIAIVDAATGARSAADGVGEIWVRSPGVGGGYWRQSESSEASFGVRLADGTGPFLRTGDLGFVHEGELFIAGRLKDLIIMHGGNHYPQDLEWTAEHAHAALRPGHGAAFAIDTDDGEALVLALETERRAAALDADAIARAVRRAIGETHGLPVEVVVLVRSGSLPRTASGKIQRQRCRQYYLEEQLAVQAAVARDAGGEAAADGHLPPVARALRVMPRDATEQALWDIWREVLGTAAFGVHESFFELGGTSLLMTQVASRVGQRMGLELSLAALFEHTSVVALADHVVRSLAGAGAGSATAAPAGIERVPRGAPLPVSLSQRRMWVIQQFDPGSWAYNVAISVRVRGVLDVVLLQRAVDLMVERHEGLRTRFVLGADEPMQFIEPRLPVRIDQVDLGGRADRIDHARGLLAERVAEPFDLARAPLHCPVLLRFDAHDHVLLWVMHHSIADNWSCAVLMREALTAYGAWAAGGAPVLDPIPVEYADYAVWQRSAGSVAQRRPQMDYWIGRLRDLGPLDLPTDFARPARPSFRGARVSASLTVRLRSAVRAFCARESVTPFVVLLAAFKLLLARQARSTDIAVGTPVANRHRFAAEHLVGTLVNTLVMRTDLSGDPAFVELAQRVRQTAVQAYAHQEAPFDELIEALGRERAAHPEGLVRVLFNVLNAPLGQLDYAGLEVEEFPFERTTAQFDLSVHIDTEFAHRIHFEYSTDLYARASIERMLENYLALLDQVLAQPAQPLSAFAMVSPAQLAFLRHGWNATQVALPAEPTVHRCLKTWQTDRCNAVAVIDADGNSLRYGELESRSNALARALRARGIGRGHRVGLGVARDAGMVVALLAVLKSGAAYVPLDPGFPAERLRFMVDDAGLSALLTRHVPHGWLADCGVPILGFDDDALLGAHCAAALDPDPLHDATPLDAAYLIYTSGSTGRPKGVVVPHRAVVNFLASMAREPGLACADCLLAVSTLSFDIAVLELLLPLAVGARVVIADAVQVRDPYALRAMLERHGATVMQATPTLWAMLVDAGWSGGPGFRALIGGEPLPPVLAERLLARTAELWNMYGPTETTVWSTVWRVVSPRESVSIGRPIANTTIQVLDAHGHPCPIGVPGELCIGGAGVALGYHRRDELSAERFPVDACGAESGSRLYRTGDLGRWRHDGWLEHLGRLDRQVKVRGLRIELGEIEAALLDHPQVAQAAVVTRAEAEGDVRLVAYAVPRGTTLDVAGLREHLRTRLPEYMLPQHVVPLDALPLLPSGKIHHSALPAPKAESPATACVQPAAPATEAERAIAAIWSALLGVERIDLRDNFFDLGGHSLLAMRAVVAIREQLGWQVQPPRLVFETLAQIARPDNLSASRTGPPVPPR